MAGQATQTSLYICLCSMVSRQHRPQMTQLYRRLLFPAATLGQTLMVCSRCLRHYFTETRPLLVSPSWNSESIPSSVRQIHDTITKTNGNAMSVERQEIMSQVQLGRLVSEASGTHPRPKVSSAAGRGRDNTPLGKQER